MFNHWRDVTGTKLLLLGSVIPDSCHVYTIIPVCQLSKILNTCSQGESSQVPSFLSEMQVSSSPRSSPLVRTRMFSFQQVYLKTKIYYNIDISCWPMSTAPRLELALYVLTELWTEPCNSAPFFPLSWQSAGLLNIFLLIFTIVFSLYSRHPNFSRCFQYMNLNFTIELQNRFNWGWSS